MDKTAYLRFREADQNNFWKRSRRRLTLKWLGQYAPNKPDRKILDIGGACSIISSDMRRFGKVTVIEPDADMVRSSRELFGLDIRQGSLPDDLPVKGPFDIITLLDVLEHVEDDRSALRSIAGLLAPDGIFLCTVPAGKWLWSSHDVCLHHKRRYQRDELVKLLEGAGFKIRRISYYTFLLYPFTAIHRSFLRSRPSKKDMPYEPYILPGILDFLLSRIMSIESFLLKRIDLPMGSSLITTAYKKNG